MRRSALLLVVTPLVFLMGAPIVGAQPAPRAPSNDDFANAISIVPGTTVTVTDIADATVEVDQSAINSCGSATAIYHSVWYRFQMPSASLVYLSTEGSLLTNGLQDSTNTVIAVFTGDSLQTLNQYDCNDDVVNPTAELTIIASPDTRYYILVGTRSNTTLDASSVLKLNTRVLFAPILANNFSFESELTPADWTLSNATGDGRLCNDPTYVSLDGTCAIQFVSGPNESSKLKQALPIPTYFAPRKGGLLTMSTNIRVFDAAIDNAKVILKVTYTDGKPASKATADLSGQPIGSYFPIEKSVLLSSKNVGKVVALVKFKSTTGTLMLDVVTFLYSATPIVREAKVLGVPAAPK